MSNSLWVSFVLLCLILTESSSAQDSTFNARQRLSELDKSFSSLDKKSRNTKKSIERASEKFVERFSKQEQRLKKQLLKKDPQLALLLFPNVDSQFNAIKGKAENISKLSSIYSGHLDSLATSINFLDDSKLGSLTSNLKLKHLQENYTELQGKLNYTDALQKYSQVRLSLLKEQFEHFGMMKAYRKYSKQVYYYKAQMQEYKRTFEDPSKIENKLIETVQAIPQFKNFFATHSQLASIFTLPGAGGKEATVSAQTTGLQTRAMLQQIIKTRFGNNANVIRLLDENINGAQRMPAGIQGLKDKLESLQNGAIGNAKGDMAESPDFKPNAQKTKGFLQRIEIGTNLQSQRARGIFPVTNDLGLSIGYKLNDKSIIGIGGSYKIGLGNGWNKIKITHQGVGLRSFIDYKIKGSTFLSGGYEQNYRSAIHSISQLGQYSAWQSSGLIGLTKKYQVTKKMKGSMQLLWDLLSYQQVPKAHPIVFRVGYNLK